MRSLQRALCPTSVDSFCLGGLAATEMALEINTHTMSTVYVEANAVPRGYRVPNISNALCLLPAHSYHHRASGVLKGHC